MNIKKLYNKAAREYEAKNFDAALKTIDKIKNVDPKYLPAHVLELHIWTDRKNTVRKYHTLEKIIPLLDRSTEKGKILAIRIYAAMGSTCGDLALTEKGTKYFYLAGKHSKDKEFSCHMIDDALLSANCSDVFSAADFKVLYDEYAKILSDVVPYPRKFYDHKKIRVGFLSADFRRHPVVIWSWALLIGLNKNIFETHFYSLVNKPDPITALLKNKADVWHDVTKFTDEEAAQLIRDEEIDILLDLNGHTGDARFRIPAYRPASLQMSGVGYMNSTGLECFDYFLSDVWLTGNVSATSEFFNEKVLQLPKTHICYNPNNMIDPAPEPPCVKNGYVTFGCFNHYRKINDSMVRTWKRIMDAVPDSRFIVKHKIFDTDDGKNFVAERFKNLGLDLERVEMRGFTTNHLAQYADMDIALDTFPYTGGVTTCEALYMCVPVISRYGDRPGSRFGLSLLSNIGIGDLAVDSYDAYVDKAVELANDRERLIDLRKNLRDMMKNSPLMDTAGYVVEVQKTFVTILDMERKNFESAQKAAANEQ